MTKTSPRVTVAMVMRNAEPFLRECLDSIVYQSFSDFELLIVDDGSSDNSRKIAESCDDNRIRVIPQPHNFIASLNILLNEARGEYIARMDADDVMTCNRLSVEVAYLDSHPEVDAVCSCATRIDISGNQIGAIGRNEDVIAITPAMMCEDNWVCNPTAMIRRSSIERFNLCYSPDYEWAEDYAFWSALLSRGGSIHCLPDCLLHYRQSPFQVTALHHPKMMDASARIKRSLTDRVVSIANPGYSNPQIPQSNKELTLIIPFLNEGNEVLKTVKSFLDNGGKGRVEIIVINDCSYDSYPYMEELSDIPEVTYILNRERLGVAASRDKGVSLCSTPFFLLLDAHMRAYDSLWVTEIPSLLHQNDRRMLCCQTRVLQRLPNGDIELDEAAPLTFGARMIFRTDAPMPGIEWVREERDPHASYEQIQCILGAGYATSKEYWNQIGGLRGLRQYGADEQMLSLKIWLNGGECLLLKNISLGHVYRSEMPYRIVPSTKLYNNLYISETLFPIKERCKARAVAYLSDRQQFVRTFKELSRYFLLHPDERNGGLNPDTFREIIQSNRIVTSIERKIKDEIIRRIPEIAYLLITRKPDTPGLFDGAIGQAIWLFLYSRYSKDDSIIQIATSRLGKGLETIPANDFSFAGGLSGAYWAIKFLSSEHFPIPECYDEKLMDELLQRHIAQADLSSSDFSLSFGLCGILAAQLLNPTFPKDSEINSRLDNIASLILDSRMSGFTEMYYAFLWMQLRHGRSSQFNQIRHLPSDWSIASPFIPKDTKFWNISLYDGVLASSIIYMLT